MAKFKKYDLVKSIDSTNDIEYTVMEARGGGWYKIRVNEPSQYDLIYVVRGNTLRYSHNNERIE